MEPTQNATVQEVIIGSVLRTMVHDDAIDVPQVPLFWDLLDP